MASAYATRRRTATTFPSQRPSRDHARRPGTEKNTASSQGSDDGAGIHRRPSSARSRKANKTSRRAGCSASGGSTGRSLADVHASGIAARRAFRAAYTRRRCPGTLAAARPPASSAGEADMDAFHGEFVSRFGLVAGTFLFSLAGAVVPVLNAEIYLAAVAAFAPPAQLVPGGARGHAGTGARKGPVLPGRARLAPPADGSATRRASRSTRGRFERSRWAGRCGAVLVGVLGRPAVPDWPLPCGLLRRVVPALPRLEPVRTGPALRADRRRARGPRRLWLAEAGEAPTRAARFLAQQRLVGSAMSTLARRDERTPYGVSPRASSRPGPWRGRSRACCGREPPGRGTESPCRRSPESAAFPRPPRRTRR